MSKNFKEEKCKWNHPSTTKVIEILFILRCAKGRPVRKPFLQVVDTAAATALAVRLAVSARLARPKRDRTTLVEGVFTF